MPIHELTEVVSLLLFLPLQTPEDVAVLVDPVGVALHQPGHAGSRLRQLATQRVQDASRTGAQLRAARGLLNTSVSDLSERTGLAVNTIRKAEKTNGHHRERATSGDDLQSAGVLFIAAEQHGAGLRLALPDQEPLGRRRDSRSASWTSLESGQICAEGDRAPRKPGPPARTGTGPLSRGTHDDGTTSKVASAPGADIGRSPGNGPSQPG